MATAGQPRPINENKMNEFLGKVVGDFGAALSSSLVYIGQKLGLYKAMAADTDRENAALEWSNGLIGSVADAER